MRTISLVFLALLTSCDLCQAQQPTVALITQEVCPPCKPAKKLFEKLRLDGVFEGCKTDVLDKDDPVVKSLGVRILTPMVVLLEGGKLKGSINTVDTAHINALLEDVPIEPREPLKFDVDQLRSESTLMESAPSAAPPRIIKYTISTQYRNGVYQGTFLWGDVDRCLNFLGRYYNIRFVRANSGTLNIIQANYQISTPNAFAWTNGNRIYISPVANYGRSLALTLKVLVHEFGHAAGGGAHNPDPRAIMSANSGTANCIIESDARWFQAYQWKSTLRPWHEPNYMKDWWLGKVSDASVRTAASEAAAWSVPMEPVKAPRTKFLAREDSLQVAP